MHILLFNEQKANVFLSKTWGLLLPKARSDPICHFHGLVTGVVGIGTNLEPGPQVSTQASLQKRAEGWGRLYPHKVRQSI